MNSKKISYRILSILAIISLVGSLYGCKGKSASEVISRRSEDSIDNVTTESGDLTDNDSDDISDGSKNNETNKDQQGITTDDSGTKQEQQTENQIDNQQNNQNSQNNSDNSNNNSNNNSNDDNNNNNKNNNDQQDNSQQTIKQQTTQVPTTPKPTILNPSYNSQNMIEATTVAPVTSSLIARRNQIYTLTVTSTMSTQEKIKAIHDWMVMNIYYHDDGVFKCHTKEAALIDGYAVCQGYAEAFKYLMEGLGIECKVIFGTGVSKTGTESHAWNAVKLSDGWYYIDVTWDDPMLSINGASASSNLLDGRNMVMTYFLIPKSKMNADHYPESEYDITSGNGSSYSYNTWAENLNKEHLIQCYANLLYNECVEEGITVARITDSSQIIPYVEANAEKTEFAIVYLDNIAVDTNQIAQTLFDSGWNHVNYSTKSYNDISQCKCLLIMPS